MAVDQEKSVTHSALGRLCKKRMLCRVCRGRLSLVNIGYDHRGVNLRGVVRHSRKDWIEGRSFLGKLC